jgi:SET domain-containing protein
MKAELFQHNLVIKKSLVHGHGVFAKKNIQKGELIEECRCLIFECKNNCLDDYVFDVEGSESESMLLTGYGSLYNHSANHNAYYGFDKDNAIMHFKASRTIQEGEEIFIYYGSDWFSSRTIPLKKLRVGQKLSRFLAALLLKILAAFGAYFIITQFIHYFR